MFVVAIDSTSSAVYAGTRHGVRKSSDGGENWTAAGLTDNWVSVLAGGVPIITAKFFLAEQLFRKLYQVAEETRVLGPFRDAKFMELDLATISQNTFGDLHCPLM